MRILSRPVLLLLVSLLASFLFPAGAGASHLRGAMIWWCPNGQSFNPEIRFLIEVFYHGNSQPGFLSIETFHFGDGTSENVLLTTTEVYQGDPLGWYVARGEVEHTYTDPSLTVVEAGLETCCRIDEDFESFGLNNRSFGNMTVKVAVDLRNQFVCANIFLNPKVEWRSGTLGDTFEIPISTSDHNPRTCRLATEAEAGGGPHPETLTLDPDTCLLTWTPTSGDPARFWTTQVRVNQAGVGDSTFDFLLGLDADRPLCQLQRIEPGPPTRLHVLVHDPRSGLHTVAVTEAVNTTVEIPPFVQGDAVAFTVVGTKINQSSGSRLRLSVFDVAGNQTDCDPLFTEVVRATGQPESHTYGGISPEERLVTVFNGDPGLRNLAVEVNGKKFQMAGLQPGEERTLDVGSAIVARADSTFTLTAQGRPGGSAVVMIWDGGTP